MCVSGNEFERVSFTDMQHSGCSMIASAWIVLRIYRLTWSG